ncbi:DUF4235 domain-containing protein [Nocardioides sp. ChNu-153]|uniref:DUF4235 domain-containing protein n=1 Tax=unclassified Nocardioides TaxID=2615069 RepID=UPI00240566B5|nr:MULTISPECIES: DUF4235 domain-containing protein [unclassified Nocardioides]MDF9715302.1 DUF4235 domain-containing protein [Nocardioides sp. ChNu-99]MDN7122487.1 DUF4235 domain-containing protein [Nocardioides sp. ChNu-153]
MKREEPGSRSAKLLYRPIGLVSSLLAGVIAGEIFQQVWKKAVPTASDDAPRPLESEYPLREIILAAAVQGAIFSVVKALINRGGARVYQRATGDWPGD